MFVAPLKMKDIITGPQYISNILFENYNVIMNGFSYEILTSDVAGAIGNMIYQHIHNLLNQNINFLTDDLENAKKVIAEIIGHNTISLVNECRSLANAVNNQTKLGQSHSKTNFHPYDNENQEANLTNTDIVTYNDLDILINARDYIINNSTCLDKLYDELNNCCVLMYEGN